MHIDIYIYVSMNGSGFSAAASGSQVKPLEGGCESSWIRSQGFRVWSCSVQVQRPRETTPPQTDPEAQKGPPKATIFLS